MNNALLIPLLLAVSIISVMVIASVVRGIWRERNDAPGDAEDETRRERRKEEKETLKALEKWREGR